MVSDGIVVAELGVVFAAVVVELGLPVEAQLALGALVNRHGRLPRNSRVDVTVDPPPAG
jgi:hypothetical protein